MQKLSIYVTWLCILITVASLLMACGLTTPTATVPTSTLVVSPVEPLPPTTEAPATEGRCGDGVCDGPENAQNCPQDCAAVTTTPAQTTDVTFAVIEESPLTLDIYLPDGTAPYPAIILIHGGYWQEGDKATHARLGGKMAEWGYAAFAINYRLAPDHPAPAAVADVQCAVAWVREHAAEYGVDPNRIAVMGTSAGGHLAALAGLAAVPAAPAAPWQPSCSDPSADLGVQAIISCFGPLDLPFHAQESDGAQQIVTTFLGKPCQDAPDLCAAFSPVTYATAGAPPTLLIHGAADDAVSPQNSARMAAALQAAGADVTYLPVEGAQHAFIFAFQSPEAQIALEAIESFLAENLGDGGGSACANPNPHHAVVSAELLDFSNILNDGGFEQEQGEVVLNNHSTGFLNRAQVKRTGAAARTGSYGYAVTAGPNEGVIFSIKAYLEKGEDSRYSIWARSPDGEVILQPLVYGVMLQLSPDGAVGEGELTQPFKAEPVIVGPEWTQIRFSADNIKNIAYVLFSIEVGPNTTLHLDDAQVESHLWRMAEYAGSSRIIGDIPVPPEPVAPVHISFLMHIEDPSQLQTDETYFQTKSAVFREMARIFHEHGGFLTIQPEQDWPLASEAGFEPGLLAELANDYNVHYSTHTHGPNCRDDQGILRSARDCSQHPEWDRNLDDDDLIEYVRNLRDLLANASGTPVSDHNGNFDFTQASRYAEIPMLTWSAYKSKYTQRTYDRLINNPWRPGEGDALADVENFMTHHPETGIVYIPGWGQALTHYPERVLTRLRPMVSQFIFYADPQRVNTFYAVLHVDHFYSREGDPNYIAYDEATGEIIYSDEFKQHLQYWDDMLTELIDPLVAAGYLRWTSLPEMGELYLEWEAGCAER